jgi:asparagine synthase (glutamine-hydrolysing)
VSGVCGILRIDSQPVSEQDLDRQMAALSSLGRDRARRWSAGSVGMGALLMRITHEDRFDVQPLRDEARDLTFVCDARLDNREEIAAALNIDPGRLADMADSAVLFAAYRAWGAECAARLIGDFVFAAWDGEARTLSLARDHMGQRHVFFHAGDGFFAFATERKGLWALPDAPRRLPEDRIAQVLVQGSLFRADRRFNANPPDGLAAVRGGTVVTVTSDGAITETRYWTPQAAPEHQDRDESYYADAYRRILGDAVACRVRRSVAPVGLLMGGGFDSGAIAALAGPALAPTGGKLIAAACVSDVDPGGPRDPRPWIEICRRHMPHLDVRYVSREAPDAMAGLERSFFASDSAHSENRFVGDALFAAAKAQGVRVIMDGHGGDYTLNPRSKGYFVDRLRRGRWRGLAAEWRARRRRLGRSHWDMFSSEFLLYAAAPLMRRWRRWRIGLAPFGPTMPVAGALTRRAEGRGVRPPRPGYRSVRDGMLAMLRIQQESMAVGWSATASAHGLEFTQPFHDKRVVELGLAIPDDYFLRDGLERYLARTALKGLYPPEFETRRDGNDAFQPDFIDMAARLQPAIMAEIDRMEAAGNLSAYLDFAKMRRMLNKSGRPGRASETPIRQAMRAFIWGRYIEWFTGGNS